MTAAATQCCISFHITEILCHQLLPYRWSLTSGRDLSLGVHELRLRVRQREGDAGLHECQSHLQLRAPQLTAGDNRLGSQAPAAGGTIGQQSQLHQRLEGSHPA